MRLPVVESSARNSGRFPPVLADARETPCTGAFSDCACTFSSRCIACNRFFDACARTCSPRRTPCTGSLSARAVRCSPLRTPCTRSLADSACRCQTRRTHCTGSVTGCAHTTPSGLPALVPPAPPHPSSRAARSLLPAPFSARSLPLPPQPTARWPSGRRFRTRSPCPCCFYHLSQLHVSPLAPSGPPLSSRLSFDHFEWSKRQSTVNMMSTDREHKGQTARIHDRPPECTLR